MSEEQKNIVRISVLVIVVSFLVITNILSVLNISDLKEEVIKTTTVLTELERKVKPNTKKIKSQSNEIKTLQNDLKQCNDDLQIALKTTKPTQKVVYRGNNTSKQRLSAYFLSVDSKFMNGDSYTLYDYDLLYQDMKWLIVNLTDFYSRNQLSTHSKEKGYGKIVRGLKMHNASKKEMYEYSFRYKKNSKADKAILRNNKLLNKPEFKTFKTRYYTD